MAKRDGEGVNLLNEAAELVGTIETITRDGRVLGTVEILAGMSARFRKELAGEQSSQRVGRTKRDFAEISSLAKSLATKLKQLETDRFQSIQLLKAQYGEDSPGIIVPWDIGMPREAVLAWIEGADDMYDGRPLLREQLEILAKIARVADDELPSDTGGSTSLQRYCNNGTARVRLARAVVEMLGELDLPLTRSPNGLPYRIVAAIYAHATGFDPEGADLRRAVTTAIKEYLSGGWDPQDAL